MTFLANENFPGPSIKVLRAHGFTVYSIAEECPGISDLEVITLALSQKTIILTFDRDYGEIIFKHSPSNKPAVLYFRWKGIEPESAGKFIVDSIERNLIQFFEHFTVVSETAIRQRKIV